MGDAPRQRITPSDVLVAEATPHQRELAWRLNGVSWATPIDVESYVRREELLSQTALSRDGGCKYIVVHRRDDPDAIVSSVEATAKEVLVADGGAVRKGRAYAIASVYTNPVYRENGMATFMLKSLKEIIDRDSEGSALYSDIGTVYYARQGWKVYPSLQVALILGDKDEKEDPPGARYLTEGDVPDLCAKDVEALTRQFEQRGTSSTRVLFLPTWKQVSWHFTRAGFMAQALRGETIVHRGAAVEDGSAWIYWDHDFRENKLKVLRIASTSHGADLPEDEAVVTLLRMAAKEARKWGLAKVLVWNPSEGESRAAKKAAELLGGEAVFDERLDGSIPSFRWKGDRETETEWEHNEYFAWC